MAKKSFNPLKSPHDALQYILLLLPIESRQQAFKPMSIIKTTLDSINESSSELEVLRGQNSVLKEQVVALQAELTALQFQPQVIEVEKKRGRKPNG